MQLINNNTDILRLYIFTSYLTIIYMASLYDEMGEIMFRKLVLLVCSCYSILLFMHGGGSSYEFDHLSLGFSEVPLSTSNFRNDKPYNLAVSDRYSLKDGIHKFWVYSSDKPLRQNSTTNPRSEIRILVSHLSLHSYSSLIQLLLFFFFMIHDIHIARKNCYHIYRYRSKYMK